MIQSVDRSLRMLLELQGARHLSLSELASRLDLPPSTAHGLIRTLVARDLVRQDPATQRYRLGPAVLRMAGAYLDALDLRARAVPWTRDLMIRMGLPVRVGVLSSGEVIVVHHEPLADQPARMAELGIGQPAHSSALGKAMLAFEDSAVDELPSPLPAMTSSTITDLGGLRRQLDEIRLRHYATELEESVIGELSVAAPIFGFGNHIIGAISVVLGSSDQSSLEKIADPVRDVGRAISRELGANATHTR